MKRNKFSLSHYNLTTFDQGELVPVGLVEVLPGDTIQHATSAFIRVAPLLAPVMHPVRVRIHHWFVPHRLVWDDFEKFITGGPDGLDASVLPTKTITGSEGSLTDQFRLPTGTEVTVSALPYRGYALIWNENYRDQDLQTKLTISTASGPDGSTAASLQNVTWEKDYFTSARPWTQKGAEVQVQMSGSASVTPTFKKSDFNDVALACGGLSGPGTLWNPAPTGTGSDMLWDNPALAVTVNQFRQSIALQRFAEARARFGSRYTEYLRSLGVKSRDSRLDRPEYLGGGRQTIQFSEVLQTGTDYNANTGVGQMKGHGVGALRSNRYRRFFEEHGYIFTLMSVLPKTIYSQGIEKHWKRSTNEEFFQKELQHIGQAEIYNRELYAAHSQPNGIFGYQDRYDEYRRMESKISGEFKTSLTHWHMARIFTGDMALNSSFVSANPTKRILASSGTDGLYAMVNHSIQARRMLDSNGGPI